MPAVQQRIMAAVGVAALRIARQRIRSETLRRAIRFDTFSGRRGRLYIPHYWAIYQHDGRGGVFPVKKRFLVWFRHPEDDPRLSGGYPVRLADVRRLTKAEFDQGVKINRIMAQANPARGPMQYMIIATYSPPGRGGKVFPFFDFMEPQLSREAEIIARREIIKEYQSLAINERSTIRLRT